MLVFVPTAVTFVESTVICETFVAAFDPWKEIRHSFVVVVFCVCVTLTLPVPIVDSPSSADYTWDAVDEGLSWVGPVVAPSNESVKLPP